MKKIILAFILSTISPAFAFCQWLNPVQLGDMNNWSSQPGLIGWYGTTTNAPNGQTYGSGVQFTLPQDGRFGAQLVIPTFDNQMYYRRYTAGYWNSWVKVWSEDNFDPDQYLDRSYPYISAAGSPNSFSNGYTFAYAVSGTPWNGSLISYGGFGGDYDTQISSDYGPAGGRHISFRTRNGDIQTWNPWYEFYHSGNLNNANSDFTAKTVNCANVFTNGNIWAKEIRVAAANPWADYVFRSKYRLASLSRVKDYIEKNGRLPNMPSSVQISKDGVDVYAMLKLQMKKIEELTLYLLEKDKEIKILKQKQVKSDQQNNHEFQSLKKQLSKLRIQSH
ncbi:hypothetical protein MUY27_20195 [Mucilaginibacter sp. RS28]|uniref:Uncharacterized protein n=1 Tax=Mucilaginibacter straminoryzae TaxID=2932774 RepID=A0A9X1X6R2_9SPHI|nr:hypothetical protein [Mucilaginibacter straminoryzae]MCJ8212049.1 hypothetical protein [Mucilaginibacter straminoryzae]